MDAKDIDRWLFGLNRYQVKRTSPRSIEIDATGYQELDMQGAPPGWTVAFKKVGSYHPRHFVIWDQPDASLEIEAGANLDFLRIQGAADSVKLVLTEERSREVAVELPSVNNIEILHGNWSLGGAQIATLRVSNAGVSNLHVERFIFDGSVNVTRVTALVSEVGSESAQLGLVGGGVSLGSICFSDSAPFKVLRLDCQSGEELRINNFVADGTLQLKGNMRLVIAQASSDTRIQHLTIRGTAEVFVQAPLDGPHFEPRHPSALTVSIQRPGQVIAGTGRLILEAPTGAECIGDQRTPLILDRVGDVSRAELENIDVRDLTPTDLGALKATTRLIPRLPKGGVRIGLAKKLFPLRFSKGPLRSYLDSMQVGGGPDELIAAKRSYFWTELSIMLRDKHTPGATQSDVRWAAMRARQKSVKNKARSREWWLLFFYSGMGYGERIFLPLIAQLGLSVGLALTILHASLNHHVVHLTWWRMILQAIALPLSLFRVLNENQDIILHPTWAVALLRVTGVILVGLSLLAIRRVVKPE